ncbi:FAD-dependent oxidoreductase [Paenibacillus aestuarii]|uniref:FAD-dependent oxidoreductase n=1 Tax=Paenibacillus aestuarii TaxID=516965 RepID=A0ABW0K8A0_9BACL|nr:FAD-dependent oxidoreductase [Paenibacillus aestuarii]
MPRNIVIVGGVAGGASAAARLRRLNEEDHIAMLERGSYISFANCGLPYYIEETIQSRNKLFLQTPAGMGKRFRMDIRVRSEVTRIDRVNKVVEVKELESGREFQYPYDILILSTGAKPVVPKIPGLTEARSVFTLRNVPDTDRIKAFVDEQKPGHATIVGGGFIGVEMAESLRKRGVEVTLIDRNPQILRPLDPEMVKPVEQHMRMKGVELVLNDSIVAVHDQGSMLQLASGRQLRTDMLLLAVGVQPESELAAAAGLELGVKGAVRVNAQLQTSDPAIYAVGDAIEVKDRVLGFETVVPLAWGANRQGRLAADHINGREINYLGAYGTAIVKVFDLTAASTGSNEKTLRSRGIPFEAIHIHPGSHAGYYPGASPIALKVLFDKASGIIYGAQAVGADGVDKRIDVIATAMRGGLTVADLADIELAYAPPYSSAKDPVNMAGYVAANVMDGLAATMQWHEVDAFIAGGGLVIDVRDPIEREAGFIPGSINIPLNELRERLSKLPQQDPIAVSCQVGQRGYVAARILQQHGFQVRNVDGGYRTYAAMAQESKPPAAQNQPTNQPTAERNQAEATIKVQMTSPAEPKEARHVIVDACGLQCPGPIMRVYETMNEIQSGDTIEVRSTDFGFASDIAKWSEKTGNTLESLQSANGVVQAVIRKGSKQAAAPGAQQSSLAAPAQTGATMVVFSGDLDKTIAAFIIASGAAAMGKKVTMFFTFWGLNVLRKDEAPPVNKDAVEAMFGLMMPKGSRALPLSKMNMGGLGPKMIRHAMRRKNAESLESLMQQAIRSGVKLVACTMSMDIMGVKREELIDGIDYAGVASYLGDAEDAGLNLFI